MNNKIITNVTDPHRNIFCFYRAPRKHIEDSFIFDEQLENNVTKSLINTLEYCNSATALGSFLALIESKIYKDKIHLDTTAGKYHFCLQSKPIIFPEVKNKILLTISNAPSDANINIPNEQPGSRPDAWIFGDNSFIIMIESKLNTLPNEKQLEGHLKSIGWLNTSYFRVDLKWSEIYSCLKSRLSEVVKEPDHFIIEQFLKYMEVIGMAPFEGFTNSDFDFFLVYDENEDYKPIVKKKLDDFSKLVYEKLPPPLRQFYSERYIGKFTKESFWIAFRRDPKSVSPFNHCNLCLEIDEEGLSWQAVIRDGKANDNFKPIGILYKKLQDSAFFNDFKMKLSDLGSDFRIEINSRTNLAGTGRPLPGGDLWTPKSILYLDSMTDEGLNAITSLLIGISYPGVIVEQIISKSNPLLINSEQLIKQCVNSLLKLHEVLLLLEK